MELIVKVTSYSYSGAIEINQGATHIRTDHGAFFYVVLASRKTRQGASAHAKQNQSRRSVSFPAVLSCVIVSGMGSVQCT